jgi:NADH:ubiquinone oxidoreductase subunit H
MWDLRLIFLDFFLYFNFFINEMIFNTINWLDPFTQGGLLLTNLKIFYQFSQNTTVFFGIKFLLSIAFLILIRGGTPRYRYDYLTKLGWLRFIGLVLLIFFFSIIVFYIF